MTFKIHGSFLLNRNERSFIDIFNHDSERQWMKKVFLLTLLLLFLRLSFPNSFEIIPNPRFLEGGKGWLKYSNFTNGDEIKDWNVTFEKENARITGNDCQPQSRVGFRSEAIPIIHPITPGKTAIYKLQVAWRGENIHRCGIYFILQDKWETLYRYGEITGAAGDFNKDEFAFFQIPYEDYIQKPMLLLYVFHDGVGTLVVKKASVTVVTEEEEKNLISIENAPDRKLNPIAKQIVMNDPQISPDKRIPFSLLTNETPPLLPGERRFFLKTSDDLSTQGMKILGKYKIVERNVGRFWDYGISYNMPFWLKPVQDIKEADVIEAEGSDKSLPPLPPLPENKNAYLYYYGDYRYGKKAANLERDRAEMRFIRQCGFTGLCLQDNYEMDYGVWMEKKNLSSEHLTTMTLCYRDAGFRSPVIFGLLGGLDKGRITWKGDEISMEQYLSEIKPYFINAENILGEGKLWIAPIDEPNDETRRNAALKLLPLWKKTFASPLMITCNWKTSGILGDSVKRWVGAGDYPSFEALKKRGINGFYCGIDSHEAPLKFRYLAGVHAWATGLENQGYWNFRDVSGSAETELDGKQPDFLCIDPNSDPDNPVQSLPFAALREGLMDLRLLCALEMASRNMRGKEGAEIKEFLNGIRNSVLPTDRLTFDWNDASRFDVFRRKALLLWIESRNSVN
ncbi:hypothetical protein JW926_13605 [Candidatus Sumerlaeota bacterium]|nr:hypothetical protein [Candidatus Sumerlaeota bacterium]